MKLSIVATTAALLGATSTIAAPTNDGSASGTFLVKDFTIVKCPDGKSISRVYFEVKSTDGKNIDFICAPYDAEAREITDTFQDGKQYACSNSSPWGFKYIDSTRQLGLYTTGEELGSTYGSAVVTDDPNGFDVVLYPTHP